MSEAELDCQRCGACCVNPAENRAEGYLFYVLVDRAAPLLRKPDLVRRLLHYDEEQTPHLRLVGEEQRCVALRGGLGKRVRCEIYRDRPLACKRVEAGSARCLQARREHGL